MNFSSALASLKEGSMLSRKSWGDNQWIILVPATYGIKPTSGTPYHNAGMTNKITIQAHIDMCINSNTMQPGWFASSEDLMSEDWFISGNEHHNLVDNQLNRQSFKEYNIEDK